VVVEEEAAGDVEGDEHVDGVVLVRGQYEEYSEAVADPGEGVQEIYTPGSVFSDEKVEECEGDGVPREDVVATGPHSLKAQPSPGPDHVRGMQSLGPRGVRRGFTVKMDARHR